MFFSIVTVCRNAEQTVETTVRSLLRQTCRDFEYIVIDGASTDGTVERVRSCCARQSGVTIVSEPDRGIYDAMNKGVALAKGEYVYFLNMGDALADENVLARVKEALLASPADVLYGHTRRGTRFEPAPKKVSDFLFLCERMPSHQSIFAKRELFSAYRFDTKYRICADRDWLMRVCRGKATFARLDCVIANFAEGGVSMNLAAFREESSELTERYFGKAGSIFVDAKRSVGGVLRKEAAEMATIEKSESVFSVWRDYLFVILAIVLSGAIVYMKYNRVFLAASFLLVAGSWCVEAVRTRRLPEPREWLLPTCAVFTFFLSYAVNGGSLFSEAGDALRIILAFLLVKQVSFFRFRHCYVQVMLFLSVSSLLFYAFPFFNNEVIGYLPVIRGFGTTEFYNAGLYIYPLYISNSLWSYYRNQSIFWEPGAYQMFLNLALILMLYGKSGYTVRQKALYAVVFIVALLTTRSTTGYVVLLLVLGGKVLSSSFVGKHWLICCIVCLLALFLLFAFGLLDTVFKKFNPDSFQFASTTRRFYDVYADLLLLVSNGKAFFFGWGTEQYAVEFTRLLKDIYLEYSTLQTSSSSLTMLFAKKGVLCSGAVLAIYGKRLVQWKGAWMEKAALACAFLCFVCTENFITCILLLSVGLYSERYSPLLREL